MNFKLYLCILLPIAFAVDVDYYYSSPLRSQMEEASCNRLHKLQCQLSCGQRLGACVMNRCYCVSVRLSDYMPGDSDENDKTKSSLDSENIDLAEAQNTATPPNVVRPALRHHIAHFCPNLDIARECIKKCMPLGKPAFCGKDHVCYCGHQYTHMDDDSQYDPKKTYAQFADMYKKYFGTNDLDYIQ